MKILNLGWGVQSWTMAAMVALGELEPVDFAVHSDTTWEKKKTYEFAERWTPWLMQRGVNVVTVSNSEASSKVTTGQTHIPAFTVSAEANIKGQLRRQCTGRWKIEPIRRFISHELKVRGVKKSAGAVEQWLGITTDEWQRMKDSDVAFVNHRYPLIDKGMSRTDCVTWLTRNGLEVPPKSSCVFCPFHNRPAWEEMKRNEPEDWGVAVAVDAQLRDVRPPYLLFVHQSGKPLAESVIIPEDVGMVQNNLLDECDSGHCFL